MTISPESDAQYCYRTCLILQASNIRDKEVLLQRFFYQIYLQYTLSLSSFKPVPIYAMDKMNKDPKPTSSPSGGNEVNIHRKRLSQLYRYLQDNEVQISVVESAVQGAAKIVYTSQTGDGNPSIKELFMRALNVSDHTVSEYSRTNLRVSGVHSNTQNLPKLGKVLVSVVPYLRVEGEDNLSNKLNEPGFFGVREWVEPTISELVRAPEMDRAAKMIPPMVKDELAQMYHFQLGLIKRHTMFKSRVSSLFMEGAAISTAFLNMIQEDDFVLDDSTQRGKYITDTLHRFLQLHAEHNKNQADQGYLLPGYYDLHLPSTPDQAVEYSTQIMASLTREEVSESEELALFEHRYGVYWGCVAKPELM